jgi:C-terminal binding protein
MKIIILDSVLNAYVNEPDLEYQYLKEYADVELYHVDTVNQLPARALECDAIISWHLVPLGRSALSRFTRCKAIVRAAVGFDNIDLDYARSRQILVANVPDYGTDEVADHTLALSLALLRKLKTGDRVVRGGSWDWRDVGAIPRLADLRVGIVGLGRIGAAVAQRFRAFGCDVAFHDPHIGSGWEKTLRLKRCETLHDLLDYADLVTLHAPLNADTRHLINQHSLQHVHGKFLINTARGGLIDPEALESAMQRRQLRGLGLDVHADETCLPAAVLRGEEVLWSPHVAFYSDRALGELRTKAARCVLQLLLSGWHRNLVNPH